jgi:hypothetical protein
MKRVLVACSNRGAPGDNHATNFYKFGGAPAVEETLRRYGMSAAGGVEYVFVNPQTHGALGPGHVRSGLLEYLQRAAPAARLNNNVVRVRRSPRFDAILLMGCNSITWLLNPDVGPRFSPGAARAILHGALAPGGLLMVFEKAPTARSIGLHDLREFSAARLQSGVFLNAPDALDMIDALFAPTHWSKLSTGVYKRKSVSANTNRRRMVRRTAVAPPNRLRNASPTRRVAVPNRRRNASPTRRVTVPNRRRVNRSPTRQPGQTRGANMSRTMYRQRSSLFM